jgi:hypothetical protein
LTWNKIGDSFITIKAFSFLMVHLLAVSAASNILTLFVKRNLNALYPNQTMQRGFQMADASCESFILKEETGWKKD